MSKLNKQYFRIIKERTHNGKRYAVVHPFDNPMVLFSKIDGTPLASLHFRPQSGRLKTVYPKSLITKRAEKSEYRCDFQGIINQDNTEFELVITNLNSSGLINFDVLKMGGEYLKGLNEVNELRPFESYAIKCDQEDNLSLILSSIKKSSGKKLTVGESETQTKVEGTYYHLSVAPQSTEQGLVDRFKETKWLCVDSFVMMEKIEYNSVPEYWADSDDEIGYCGMEPIAAEEPKMEPAVNEADAWPTVEAESYFEDGASDLFSESVRSEQQLCAMAEQLSIDPMSGLEAVDKQSTDPRILEKKDNGDCFLRCDITSYQPPLVVKESYAAKVSGGRHITVNSVQTDIVYDYSVQSESCVLGLSVSPDIIFNSFNLDRLRQTADELIDDAINNGNRDLLQRLSRVFKQEDCVICLDDEPDVVFYQCGHQCSHYRCSRSLTNCPLCRSTISAYIKL